VFRWCSAGVPLVFRWHQRGKDGAGDFAPILLRLRCALEQGAAQERCQHKAKSPRKFAQAVVGAVGLGFITHPGMEPTNNAAEQALHGSVCKRKISEPTLSRRDDEFIARRFSVHATRRRPGLDLWTCPHRAVVAWIDRAPHPTRVPIPTG
jgi:transposase